MKITVNSIRKNATDKTVFFTLIDDANTEYKGSTDIPLNEEDEQTYCDANIERYMLFYRKKEYPRADYKSSPGETELAKFEEWINDGCMNRDNEGQYTEKIEKVPWTGTHPKSLQLDKDIDAAISIDDIKAILKELIK